MAPHGSQPVACLHLLVCIGAKAARASAPTTARRAEWGCPLAPRAPTQLPRGGPSPAPPARLSAPPHHQDSPQHPRLPPPREDNLPAGLRAAAGAACDLRRPGHPPHPLLLVQRLLPPDALRRGGTGPPHRLPCLPLLPRVRHQRRRLQLPVVAARGARCPRMGGGPRCDHDCSGVQPTALGTTGVRGGLGTVASASPSPLVLSLRPCRALILMCATSWHSVLFYSCLGSLAGLLSSAQTGEEDAAISKVSVLEREALDQLSSRHRQSARTQ